MIKILIIDDHKLFSNGLASLLQNYPEFEILRQVYDSTIALEKIHLLNPELILVDFNMPKINGMELTKMILKIRPLQKILVLSMYNEDRYIKEFKEIGAKGYLTKTEEIEIVKEAILDICNGKTIFKKIDIESNNGHHEDVFIKKFSITHREEEIIKLMVDGLTTRQIADKLFISYYTAETHRKNIYTKLGIKGGERELIKFINSNKLDEN